MRCALSFLLVTCNGASVAPPPPAALAPPLSPPLPPPLPPPPSAPPEDCSLLTSTHGSLRCVQVFVHSEVDVCSRQSAATCEKAAADRASSEGEDCVTTSAEGSGGFMWGMTLSIVCDIVISIGLAVQKVAHNRLAAAAKKEAAPQLNPEASTVGLAEATTTGAKVLTVYSMKTWWLGMALTIFGEVGNFVAYGDINTPASVVTAVGCVGVISNVVIATGFLGKRDENGVLSRQRTRPMRQYS